jgi:ion channel
MLDAPRIRDTHAYGLVLILILILFIFSDVASNAPWTATVIILLQGVTLAVALATSERSDVRLGGRGIIVIAAAVALVQLHFHHDAAVSAFVAFFSAALTVAIGTVVALGVKRQSTVNAASVSGAIAIYLLIGMLFVFLYGGVQAIGGKDFFAQGVAGDRPLFLYFSYVTMATVGYGDYTPVSQVGKTLAVTEALLGQLYLVTIVALLVSSFGRARDAK